MKGFRTLLFVLFSIVRFVCNKVILSRFTILGFDDSKIVFNYVQLYIAMELNTNTNTFVSVKVVI